VRAYARIVDPATILDRDLAGRRVLSVWTVAGGVVGARYARVVSFRLKLFLRP
jgi:hypothetical protein